MVKFTAKQQKFIVEYCIDLNATQAAIRAGYSPKSARQIGTELLSKLSIREAIDTELDRMRDAALADAYEVERYLTSVLRGQSQAEVVVVEGIGDGCSEARTMSKGPDEKERLKAAEILAKRHGLTNTTKLKLEGGFGVSFSGENELE